MISFKKILPVSVIAMMFSCSDPEPDLRADPQDANGMSNAWTFNQEEKVPGDLPAASTNAAAPVLKNERDSTFMFGWSHANIFPSVVSGDISGFYVQVKGADHYYKIKSKYATVNGGGVGFGFGIENSSKPGMFTIRYSIFDTEGRTSNIVEQDVFVMDYGSSESMFPLGVKQSVKQTTHYLTDRTLVVVVGVPNKSTSQDLFDCTGQPDKILEYTTETLTNETSYVFSADGSSTLFASATTTDLDKAGSNAACSPKYLTTTYKSYYEGKWGFISDPNRLLVQLNLVDTVNGVRTVHGVALTREYSVHKDGSTLIWRSEDNDKEEVIFK